MAGEDVLRMRATLRDDASPGVANLRKNLAGVGKEVETSKARRELAALQEQVKGLAGEAGVEGLISSFGKFTGKTGGIVVGIAAVGAAFYGIGRQLQEFANKTAELKFAAQDMGVSAAQLKAFQKAAGEVRIDPGSAQAALQSFTRNAEDFRLRIGSVREELYKFGAGDVVEAIGRAKTPIDGLRIAFERMQELQRRNPVLARRFAEAMFGTAEATRMSWREIEEFIRKTEASGKYTDEAIARSEAFRKKWEELDRTLEGLKERTLTPLFPAFTAGVEKVNTAIDKLKEGIGWINEHLPSWGGGERAPNLSPRAGANQQQLGDERRSWWQRFWQGPGASRLGGARPGATKEDDDLKKQSGDLAENFKKMNFELSRPGDAGGGGGIINASFGGGAGAARGGGFRPFGGGYSNLGPFGPGGAAAPGSAPGGGGVPRSFNNPLGGTSEAGANPLTGPSGALGIRRPMESAGGTAGITAPAGTPIQRGGMATVTTAGGRKFQVDARFKDNFQGFINDYEKAGGVIGPESGTLGSRPHNASGHPIGAAIDINQVGYGVRGRGGRTLPTDVENSLAAKWGLVSGANWRRPDTGHFGIRSEKAARDALIAQGMAPAQAESAAKDIAAGRTVKGSWFGSGPGWNDPSEPASRRTASGKPLSVPGIALPSREGLGKMFEVTTPDGRKFMLPQTDIGPAARTGRGIDINSAAATQMGYTAKTFPTDAQFGYRRAVDQNLAASSGAVKAEGTVNVNVHAAAGTKVDAKSDGLFQSTRIQRYRQMEQTGLDGGAQ
ncbi:hypothetical protein [Bradyrhizobium sp. 2S1]|uniref:hypothetical protein n=1 Tax=Bradyrhizobium sp. 2S1 TaxID=1404429 RepID=UPI00140DD843|nr:hypothetical protein [Bradyrhizobium sp. 2S1]MCK7672382.1 hypothetical protein [Bradyrhizobium sp. 2S1]